MQRPHEEGLEAPPRFVGFGRKSFSSGDLQQAPIPVVTCSLTLPRQPSEGSLKRLFQGGGGAGGGGPPRPLAPIIARRRVPRLQSFILVAGGGQHDGPVTPVAVALAGHEAGDRLPTGAGDGGNRLPRLQVSGLRRTGSIPLDITPRIHRSQTAPEGLPDSVVIAALATGHDLTDSSPTGSSSSGGGGGGSFGAAASKTVPSKRPLHAVLEPGSDSGPSPGTDYSRESPGSTASFNTASSASLLSGSALSGLEGLAGPVTPAAAVAAAARRRRHQQAAAATAAQLLQARSCSFRDLFEAQAEATTAQVQVHALQTALQRKDEELARLELELAAVAAERDQLRMHVGGGALAAAAAAAASAPAEPARLRPLSRHRSAGPLIASAVPGAGPGPFAAAAAADSPFASALPFTLTME
ncbi:hypothetical protein ABPG75_011508 [Micractinium tetrahymenae]